MESYIKAIPHIETLKQKDEFLTNFRSKFRKTVFSNFSDSDPTITFLPDKIIGQYDRYTELFKVAQGQAPKK